MNESSIRLVCFDLGGVVVRTCASFSEGCQKAGIPVRKLQLTDEKLKISNQLHNIYQCGQTDLPTYAQQLSELFKSIYTPLDIIAVHKAWLLGEYEGILDIINQLNKLGLEVAALSNTCCEHWKYLIDYPSIKLMKHKFASHLVGFSKPQAEIYQVVEQETGFSQHEILFFDDLAENIAAAKDRGWLGKQINPKEPTDVQIEQMLITVGIMQ